MAFVHSQVLWWDFGVCLSIKWVHSSSPFLPQIYTVYFDRSLTYPLTTLYNIHQLHISQTMATTATLPALPVELLHQISQQLSYGSHIALSFTCRELYFKLDARRRLSASSTQAKAYTMADLLEIEQWPEYSPSQHNVESRQSSQTQFLSCRLCLRIRRGVWFSHPDKFYYGLNREDVMNQKLDRCCALCVSFRYLNRGETQPLSLDCQACRGCGDVDGGHEPYSQRLFGEYFCKRCLDACLGRNIQTGSCGPFIHP